MATICGSINKDLLNDCTNRPVAGVAETITLINIEDLGAVTYDADNPQIIRSLALAADTRGYKFQVYKNTHKPRVTFVQGTYGPYWNHEIETAIMSWDSNSKEQLEALTEAKVIAIVENLQKSGDARFEVYGFDSGLGVTAAVRDTAANNGVATLTLGNEEENPEPHLPKTFAIESAGAYSYTLTKAAVDALSVPLEDEE